MLGEMLGEVRGKVTGQRVLQDGKVEVSFQQSGKVLGVDLSEMGTYSTELRSDGTLFGEGQGVHMYANGNTAAWKGGGVGKFTRPGAVSFRGAIYFQTKSEKLARLNTVAVVFEYEADENGNTHAKVWEWK